VTVTYLAYIPSPAQGVWHVGPFPLRVDVFVGSVVLRLVSLTIWVYWGAILIYVLLGWVVQGYHLL